MSFLLNQSKQLNKSEIDSSLSTVLFPYELNLVDSNASLFHDCGMLCLECLLYSELSTYRSVDSGVEPTDWLNQDPLQMNFFIHQMSLDACYFLKFNSDNKFSQFLSS